MTRELHATADSPQNHIAIATNAENRAPAFSPSAVTRIVMTAGTSLPLASLALSTEGMSLIARVRAISNRYPTRLDTTTAITMPQGTRRRGSTVSSETLAD